MLNTQDKVTQSNGHKTFSKSNQQITYTSFNNNNNNNNTNNNETLQICRRQKKEKNPAKNEQNCNMYIYNNNKFHNQILPNSKNKHYKKKKKT